MDFVLFAWNELLIEKPPAGFGIDNVLSRKPDQRLADGRDAHAEMPR
jgi:hypothetical protein